MNNVTLVALSTLTVVSLTQANAASIAPATERSASVIWLENKCLSKWPDYIHSKEEIPVALIAPLAGFASDFIINGISKFLERRKEALNGKFIASGVADAGLTKDGKAAYGCIGIGRGALGSFAKKVPQKSGLLTSEHLNALGLSDYPAFYFEAEIQISEDGASLTLKPTYIHYAESSAERVSNANRKRVGLVLALTENTPPKGEEVDQAASVFRFDLGDLEVGKYYAPGLLKGMERVAKFEPGQLAAAHNLTAVVSESESPDPLFALLAETFDAKKSDFSSALKQIIEEALKAKDEEDGKAGN